MENSLKGLMLAAGTIITCVVISLGFLISREAKDTASNGANQINKLNAEFVDSDKDIYDGATVSGSEVLNAIKKFHGEEIGVLVKTNKSETFYGYSFDEDTGEIGAKSDKTYTIATETSNKAYINPYVNFKGTVIRDKNDVITGIIFKQ